MSPDRAWKAIRDVGITVLGFFILIHETISDQDPNLYLITAATTCLGLPGARRADEKRREGVDDVSDASS